MTSTILATFADSQTANNAIKDLTDAGFNRSDIGLAVYDAEHGVYTDDVSGADGAGVGAVAGSIFGAVVGLAAITIPGVGPVIAAGPLAAAMGALAGAGIGAASGAMTGGIVASLMDLGIPEEDAHTYAESLKRGSALVSVNAYDVDADRAVHILQTHNPIDIDRQVAKWREEGWSGFDPKVPPYNDDKAAQIAYGHDPDDAMYPADDPNQVEKDIRHVRRYPMPETDRLK
jgi:uncharacterized membrane protein